MSGRDVVVLIALAGCASPPVEDPFPEVARLASQRLGEAPVRHDDATAAEVEAHVARILGAPLTADACVRVALLAHPRLQAEYARLGVSRADVVQAGRIANPIVSLSARFPDRAPRGPNLEFGVVQELFDLLARPDRRRLAEAELLVVQRQVAATVVDHAAAVRHAYYDAVGARQILTMRGLVVEAAEASAELARRMYEAGNLSDLQLTNERVALEDARLAHAAVESDASVARERLAGLLGVWRPEHLAWTLPATLPALPDDTRIPPDLEALAMAQRLDLAAARAAIEKQARALGLATDSAWPRVLEVGLDTERDTDGQYVTGPSLAFDVPLFDDGDARVAREQALLQESVLRHTALTVDIRADVRVLRDQLAARRRLAEHALTVVVPLHEARVAYARQEHDFMLMGAFELILAKQAEYDAYQTAIAALRDYWIVRSDLEQAVGGTLPAGPPPARAATVAPPSEFTCPMHTDVRSATQGSCPVCGMGLVPVTPAPPPVSAPEPTTAPAPASEPHSHHDRDP